MASCVLSTRKQHVVAVPLPRQGHINSLMRFCKLLASQGVRVTFVNIDPVHERIRKLSQQDDDEAQLQCEEETHAEIRRAHIPIEGLDLANGFRVSLQHYLEAQNSIAPHLEDLIQKLNRDGPPVTCLISDILMTLPTHDVAEKFGIPRVVLFPFCASILLLLYYVIQGERISTKKVLEALTRLSSHRREIICEGLPGLPTIHDDELPNFQHVVDDNVFVWELTAQSLRYQAHAMVLNSFEELEHPAFMTLSNCFNFPIYGVGPFVERLHKNSTTSLWKEDEACMLWLDQQPASSVVYISFGSITLLTRLQFEEILEGLLCSQQRFLWVIRPDLVENGGDATFIRDVHSKSHGKGFVVDWAPQLEVLSHPSVGGFLTHCGWNSTTEAIARGMPMLCLPYYADQFLVAKYVVEEWKVGLRFEVQREGGFWVEKREVERVIQALMVSDEGKALKNNIIRLKGLGCQSLLPGGTSHKNVQTLIQSLM